MKSAVLQKAAAETAALKGLRLADLEGMVGEELAVSPWFDIDQETVNSFAEATLHTHWMHTDPARATAEGPYGGAIAHGFLMLSMVTHCIDACGLRPVDSTFGLNYGLEKARFIAPVVIGDGFRIRDRIGLASAEWRDKGLLTRTTHLLEVESIDRPAVYAEYLSLWIGE